MANPKDVLFGPVIDEQKGYWEENPLRQRDKALLDRHFDSRAQGNKWQTGISAYSLPKTQKSILRESRVGGIPTVEGGESNWEEAYLLAQQKLAGQHPSIPDPWSGRRPGLADGEVDVGSILQQRMASQAMNHSPMPGHAMATGQQSNQQAGPPVCTLQEGHTFYHVLKIDGFGTTQPLARTGGIIKGLQGRQFQVDGSVSAYIIDGLQTIDLQKMEPGRLRSLIRVTAPLVGTFLVPQEAIAEMSGGASQNGGRQLLIDSSQQHRQRQAQANHGLLISQPQRQRQPAQPRPTNPQEILQHQGRDLLRRRGLLKG